MDKRKDAITTLKICRFCLTQDVPMATLYDKKRKIKNTVNLPLKILSCVSVEVFPSDKMPTYICERCKYFMNLCYDFKQICRQADEAVLHYIQDNKAIKPIIWPVSLNNAYRDSNDIGVMKTVVDGGTTVQVTHDMSDSEDEEENVYNVKINDGTDEVSKTCVKVVASRDEDKRDSKGMERCWPCDECNCTYPLQQMLQLHKMKKHRKRNVTCEQCEDKFFTKYDLAIHQLRHSEDMPFQCVACDKKFKRVILLKRHEKLIHADLAQQICPHCSASFLSYDQLEEHQKKHEKLSERPYSCIVCDKKFLEKSSLQRHIQLVHNRELNYACEYCPQRFSSVSKLTKHVRTHAGDRPYPCKYCDKSFLKSHHYTRHLRMKHREEDRVRSGNGDIYRCDQCEISFNNQDELIYHSAIHATQNLTCPLCQEKFDDVDAVTAHIKSHVNGMEFMCDFCELVFTRKEKLENHMVLAHEDEIQNELGQDESSMEAEDMEGDAEDDDDDNSINVKEEDDHMVIEIKKADEFLLKEQKSAPEEKLGDNSDSDDSDSERASVGHVNFDKMAQLKMVSPMLMSTKDVVVKNLGGPLVKPVPQGKQVRDERLHVRKPAEIKHGVIQRRLSASPIEKREKQTMAQVTKIETANDKSLRLLEKELQDLKRTNSRSEVVKTPPMKIVEAPRGRGRPPLHTSTPKIKKGIYRPPEERKPQLIMKTPTIEKKQVEKKIITKENKEPKVVKETKLNNNKEDKDTNKSVVKNGANEKSSIEDGVRRSTRPSKIKDYAKMIRVNTQEESDSDEINDDDEYKQSDKSIESQIRVRGRRNSVRARKSSPALSITPTTPASPATIVPTRKRGRPRKDHTKEIPIKVKKTDPEPEPDPEPDLETEPELEPELEEKTEMEKSPSPESNQLTMDMKQDDCTQDSVNTETEPDTDKVDEGKVDKVEPVNITNREDQISPSLEEDAPSSPSKLVSPTGQTLKKIPIRSLPPGVKPLPLPLVGRNIPPGELCEMQIGKKVVKVQKIIMTKAEVEAMAKKGLVEMKDGTMVLKQGVKLPKVESVPGKTASLEDSQTKREKAIPTRCNFGED